MTFDIAIVNRNTDFHLLNLLRSLERIPDEAIGTVRVWDNGSTDSSRSVLDCYARRAWSFDVHQSAVNEYHGPALDALIRASTADWVLLLDSDTEIVRDFVPDLTAASKPDAVFVGQIHPQMSHLYAYLAHLLINRRSYLELPGFRHHGAPGIDFFKAVQDRQAPYVRFRWTDYVDHFGQATLRDVFERRETSNEFYDFAVREMSAALPDPGRESREAALRRQLSDFLSETAPAGRDDTVRDGCGELRAPSPAHARSRSQTRTARSSTLGRGRLAAAGRDVLHALVSPRTALTLRTAGKIGIVQKTDEIRRLVRLVRRLSPRLVLEIGTAHGGTFYHWTRVAADDATLISVDRPPWELDDPWEVRKVEMLQGLGRRAQRIHLIRQDSHAPDTLARVSSLIGGAPVDFLFIDGDHSLDGVRRDFQDYSPFVRKGGLIALHDIHPHAKGWGGEVPRFWSELQGSYRTDEIISDPAQDGFGIGLLWI